VVWQQGLVEFNSFFLLCIPSLVNFLVPAAFMHFAIPAGHPPGTEGMIKVRRGGRRIMLLFAATILTTITFHKFLHLPPFIGMMTGLAYLQFFGYYLRKSHRPTDQDTEIIGDIGHISMHGKPFDIFRRMARAEWDTLLFFYGVVLCVGGPGFIGYLGLLSEIIYIDMGPAFANVSAGIISAILDNIPVMFAVLSMNPDMSLGHWLLVTLTAGVGGSLLSIGSAAGVALMGQAQGRYAVFGHLKVDTGHPAGLRRVNPDSHVDQFRHIPAARRGLNENHPAFPATPPAVARYRGHYVPGQLHPDASRAPEVRRRWPV
jgi:Na+/H+ antiporter NhaD/arsenite permease-like protein